MSSVFRTDSLCAVQREPSGSPDSAHVVPFASMNLCWFASTWWAETRYGLLLLQKKTGMAVNNEKKFILLQLYNSLLTFSKTFFSFIYSSKIIMILFWFANVSAHFFGKSPCAETTHVGEKLFAKLSWIHWMLPKHEPNNKSSAWKRFWRTNFWSAQIFGNCNEAVSELRELLQKMLSKCGCAWLLLS